MKHSAHPHRRIALIAPLYLPVLGWVLSASCVCQPRYDDCFERGECECRGPGDCPAGEACVNGHCSVRVDASVRLLGFGEICLHDHECESSYCIPSSSGTFSVCTRECEADCPPSWDCKIRGGPEPVSLCVQHLNRLCLGCSVDAHCHPAFGDRCLSVDGAQVCGLDCTWEACPTDYTCETVLSEDGSGRQCVPVSGSCDCTPESVGLIRGCTVENSYGACHGETTCLDTEEWSPCTGRDPEPEICNGLDDDCDGWLDADDPTVDISTLPVEPPYPTCQRGDAPSCQGRWTCQEREDDRFVWVCDAPDIIAELCDGLDNDCDGDVDEDFVDDTGAFRHPEHCGQCGVDCTELVAHLARGDDGLVVPGAVECLERDGVTACVPRICEAGHAPYPEGDPRLCLALISPQCRSCVDEEDCLLAVDRCAVVGDDPHGSCLQGCGPGAAYGGCTGLTGLQGCCPDGHTCELLEGGLACVPEGDTCDCDARREGAQRSCYVEGGAGAVCVGEQTCLRTGDEYAWTDCDASLTSVEVCDGRDNDCNGEVDEPYIDRQGTGTYDVDEHCGACDVNCLARWSEEIQHAIGGCVASDTELPHCEIVACTSELLPFGAVCRVDVDCPPGQRCDPVDFTCARSCAGDADCPDPSTVCRGDRCALLCDSDADCLVSPAPGPRRCEDGVCQREFTFADVDSLESNGCECRAPVGEVDRPELFLQGYPEPGWPYPDHDCDGVDGVAEGALFVWLDTPRSRGTLEEPYATLGEALDAFDPARHTAVFVASGYYAENIVVPEGAVIIGGFAPGFAGRDVVLHPTIIAGHELDDAAGDPQGTVSVLGAVSQRTVVAGFVIYGYDVNTRVSAGSSGHSSYAVYIADSSDSLVVANNVIVAGRGGSGGHGRAGTPGGSGSHGGDGRGSVECSSTSCSGERQRGGIAGGNDACPAAGSPGAESDGDIDPQGYSSSAGGNGTGGSNAMYTSASNPEWSYLCKYDCQVPESMNGGDAESGGNGSSGDGGGGCSAVAGYVSGGVWNGGASAGGVSGNAGQGGGGGGAGGCVINQNPPSCTVGNRVGDLGATGGGGGAGGCGGAGGQGGGAGGGSFGIFLVGSAGAPPVIQGNIVIRGEGGAGGNGGYGGHGGLGGEGGEGGVSINPAWCAGFGGKGGRGGDGGAGGGGGGGCGGPSFAIAGSQSLPPGALGTNEFPQEGVPQGGGPAGGGGPSPAGTGVAGSEGSDGAWGDVHVF